MNRHHKHRHHKPYQSVLDLVGWTPMVRLHSVCADLVTPVFAKCEFMNPGGSIKDRIGIAMLDDAENRGLISKGGTVVEATAGNTGLALAMAAAVRGYRCICVMPDKMSKEKVGLLEAFGADVVMVPSELPQSHPDHYLNRARAIGNEMPEAWVAGQFDNAANPQAHYESTGPEIWEQSGGRVTHFVASAGTGGTISGVGRHLKERDPSIRIVGIDPEGSGIAPSFAGECDPESRPYHVEGVGNEGVPETLDLGVIDEYRTVGDGAAMLMARRLTREEGLFGGGSSGLLVHGAVEVAREINDPNAFVVTLIPDWGEHYLSKTYNDVWMREQGFLPPEADARQVPLELPEEPDTP